MKCLLSLFLLLSSLQGTWFDQTSLTAGFLFYQFNLNENQTLYHESNLLCGAVLQFHLYTPHIPYIGFKGEIAEGHLQGSTYFGQEMKAFALEKTAEGRAGYNFLVGSCRLTPFSGIGYYILDDQYLEMEVITRSRIFYIPIGLSCGYLIHSHCILGINFQVNAMIQGNFCLEGHPTLSEEKHLLDSRLFFLIEFPLCISYKKIDLHLTSFGRWGTFSKGRSFETVYLKTIGGQCEIGFSY